ncbi:MAG: hypothetical protein KJT01_02900 [Gemmatimonadetes bacterium]|nr:hypothetical protein [Gemmatimonadota bacterium]
MAVVLAVALLPGAVAAQSCTTGTGGNASCEVGTTVPATIAKVTQLEVTEGATVSLGTVSAAGVAAGAWDAPTTLTVTARANAPWGVTIASTTAAFTAPCASKSASALRWGRSSGTRTTPLGTTPASLFPAASNAASAGSSQVVWLSLQVGWTTDPPRLCPLGLAFTLTAP